jgi:hypothetical protein
VGAGAPENGLPLAGRKRPPKGSYPGGAQCNCCKSKSPSRIEWNYLYAMKRQLIAFLAIPGFPLRRKRTVKSIVIEPNVRPVVRYPFTLYSKANIYPPLAKQALVLSVAEQGPERFQNSLEAGWNRLAFFQVDLDDAGRGSHSSHSRRNARRSGPSEGSAFHKGAPVECRRDNTCRDC